MLYPEIDPKEYRVDGLGLDGIQSVTECAITIGEQVGEVCDRYNFAVIENTFSPKTLKLLGEEAASHLIAHDNNRSTIRYNDPRAYGIDKTPESVGLPDGSLKVLGGLTHALYAASAGHRILDTPHDGIDAGFVTRYRPNARVRPHYDQTTGVTMETTLSGRLLVMVRVGLFGRALVELDENTTLVLPGDTPMSRGAVDKARHSVRNKTPSSNNQGYRLGITYIYGRTPPPNAHLLQSAS